MVKMESDWLPGRFAFQFVVVIPEKPVYLQLRLVP